MPHFGHMVIVDANAPLIDFEGTHYSGQSGESIKCLIIKMENIWEWHMYNVSQSDWDMLSI